MKIIFRISHESYKGKDDKLEGVGQGNIISRVICRDILYALFKKLEKKNLVIKIKASQNEIKLEKLVIAFTDNMDFFTSNEYY